MIDEHDREVPVPYDDLSEQDKLDMLFRATGQQVFEWAAAGKMGADVRAAREAARQYAEEHLRLE